MTDYYTDIFFSFIYFYHRKIFINLIFIMNHFMKTVTLLMVMLICVLSGCKNQSGSNGTFEIGDKTFLLNGKPFIIKAAEIHYTRIPVEYWEHRIQMCKALGMNTICIYAFWNIHEQKPGEFDFSGQNDIAAFCRLAQKNGMYIMLRPGPYVCSEWEMGGLPWWLLKKEDIQLRTNDPYFIERTRIYMNEIGKQLADRQITRGGNIIMVQVENEYGSYATDKSYIAKNRDILREAGFTDVPLFQCDWSSNFLNNALDDLVWTVNFGTGANIDEQFKKLKEVRPNTPLMCSEFWSGWFDHWGRKHETRDAETMIAGLREVRPSDIGEVQTVRPIRPCAVHTITMPRSAKQVGQPPNITNYANSWQTIWLRVKYNPRFPMHSR